MRKRLTWPSWIPVDPFILLLLATVGLAALLPARGVAAQGVSEVSTAALALLFFLYGARLSTREALAGLAHWRLHVTVLVCTFVVFPALGLAGRALVPEVLTPALYSGFLFLTLVPSTIQASIAFTSIARGNVPAAICAGSFSSLLGVVVTPLLVAGLLNGSGAGFTGFSPAALVQIVLQLLVPFLAGQVLRRWMGGFLLRYKQVLGRVDRSSILLVVYTAFSEGMVRGIWHQITPLSLLGLLGTEAVLLAVMLTLTWYGTGGSGRFGFDREDRIAIQFAGSKKSLATGLPMASVLFGAHASLAVLPLMLFHQMQLMVCAVIARRRARDPQVSSAPQDLSAPQDPEAGQPRAPQPPDESGAPPSRNPAGPGPADDPDGVSDQGARATR